MLNKKELEVLLAFIGCQNDYEIQATFSKVVNGKNNIESYATDIQKIYNKLKREYENI